MAPVITGINHLVLVCKDMEETLHFYRDLLGLRVKATLPGNRTPGNMDLHAADLYGNGRFDLIVALNTRNQDGRRKLRSELLVIDATGAIKFFYQTAASAPAEEITVVLSGAPSAIGAENLLVIKSIKDFRSLRWAR